MMNSNMEISILVAGGVLFVEIGGVLFIKKSKTVTANSKFFQRIGFFYVLGGILALAMYLLWVLSWAL